MSKKSTIVLFYTGVAVLSAVLLCGFIYWGGLVEKKAVIENKERVQERLQQMVTDNIKQDRLKFSNYGMKEELIGYDQSGEQKNFTKTLKGKVVVMAQFYASCPNCMQTNFGILKEIREKYGKHKDLQIVTVNVNDAVEDKEDLKAYAKAWGDPNDQWLFVKTDEEKFNTWANKNLGFGLFSKNTGENADEEPVLHDMGIVVVGRDQVMVNKEDIDSVMRQREGVTEEESNQLAGVLKQELFHSIERALGAK